MPLALRRIRYEDLNARQQESHNFQKVSAVLADYGFTTIRLSDDWQGADFIAQHVDGVQFLKDQLKGRLTLDQKYGGRDLYICFRDGDQWYLYPHDDLVTLALERTGVGKSESWATDGHYSFPRMSEEIRALLEPYRL